MADTANRMSTGESGSPPRGAASAPMLRATRSGVLTERWLPAPLRPGWRSAGHSPERTPRRRSSSRDGARGQNRLETISSPADRGWPRARRERRRFFRRTLVPRSDDVPVAASLRRHALNSRLSSRRCQQSEIAFGLVPQRLEQWGAWESPFSAVSDSKPGFRLVPESFSFSNTLPGEERDLSPVSSAFRTTRLKVTCEFAARYS